MTKSEYGQYLASPAWKQLRDEFIQENPWCERCNIPRWLAAIAYDQDLHAHHVSYENLGTAEEEYDLASLCRRCHEIETFGKSLLKAPWSAPCNGCGEVQCFDRYQDILQNGYLCNYCLGLYMLAKGMIRSDRALGGKVRELLTIRWAHDDVIKQEETLHKDDPDWVPF